MFEPLLKCAPVRLPAKVNHFPYDVRLFALRKYIIFAVFRKSYNIFPLISVFQLEPVLNVHLFHATNFKIRAHHFCQCA